LRKIIIGSVVAAAFVVPGAAVAASLPKVPLYYQFSTSRQSAQVRPANTTLTGDGASIFGGRTGHAVMNESQLPFGTLKWPTYTNTKAVATGVWWGKFTRGYHVYRIFATARLTWSRPTRGSFSRLSVRLHYTHGKDRGRNASYDYDYQTEKYSHRRGPGV
jgi:hypothetical protein